MAERNIGPAGKGQHAVHRGRHLDGDQLAGKRLARDGARLASGGRPAVTRVTGPSRLTSCVT